MTALGAGAGALAAITMQDLSLAQRLTQFGQFHLHKATGFTAAATLALHNVRYYLESVAAAHWQWLELGIAQG